MQEALGDLLRSVRIATSRPSNDAWQCIKAAADAVSKHKLEESDDYVSSIRKLTAPEEAKKIRITSRTKASSRDTFARGGFGSLFRSSIIVEPATSGATTTIPVVVKVIKPRVRTSGTDTLNEITFMSCLDRSRFLMPALRVEMDSRSSEVFIALPEGICDLGRLIRSGTLDYAQNRETIRTWCGEIVCAISELHSNGIAHGDIKPGNIIMFPNTDDFICADAICCVIRLAIEIAKRFGSGDEENAEAVSAAAAAVSAVAKYTTLRLSDFGLSSFVTNESMGTVERTSAYSYTAAYRPPEVWADQVWSYPSDVWALGCTVYEMVFQRALFSEHRDLSGGQRSTLSKRVEYLAAHHDFAKTYDLFTKESPIVASSHTVPTGGSVDPTVTGLVRCSMRVHRWMSIEQDLRSFMGSCLQLSPRSRLFLFDFLKHPYITNVKRVKEAAETLPNSPPRLLFDSLNFLPKAMPPGTSPDPEGVACEQFAAFAASTPVVEEHVKFLKNIVNAVISDRVVQPLALWTLSQILPIHKHSKSVRVRNMKLRAIAAICACIAAKTLRRQNAADESAVLNIPIGESSLLLTDKKGRTYAPPSAARDERAICEQLKFRLFPFSDSSCILHE